jgi:pimeloyl-ACP methyl ester carboxylesterase
LCSGLFSTQVSDQLGQERSRSLALESRLLRLKHRRRSSARGGSRAWRFNRCNRLAGGRPDLAGSDALQRVKSPTLLIVGGFDGPVIKMNEEAYAWPRCEKDLKVVPNASHLFEEPGKLEEVARLAAEWFERCLQLQSSAAG